MNKEMIKIRNSLNAEEFLKESKMHRIEDIWPQVGLRRLTSLLPGYRVTLLDESINDAMHARRTYVIQKGNLKLEIHLTERDISLSDLKFSFYLKIIYSWNYKYFLTKMTHEAGYRITKP